MKITKRDFEGTLRQINEYIENSLLEKALSEYIRLYENIEDNENEIEKEMKGEFYSSFAFFMFSIARYEECLELFINAQKNGFPQDELKDIIWQAFIEPNIKEFKKNYNENIKFLIKNGMLTKYIEFDQLSFWLIPVEKQNHYYLYDKNEKVIKDKFYFDFNSNEEAQPVVFDEFSDYLIEEVWNFNNVIPYLNIINNKNKKSYLIINEMNKFLSTLQGGLFDNKKNLNSIIFSDIDEMEEYFINSNTYLPRNFENTSNKGRINNSNSTEALKNRIDIIHENRIKSNVKNERNVFLSVCIPSYNRGKVALDNLKLNLKCNYDEEIEFVLSNNGTQNESKKYYSEIANIKDSRLVYFEFEENQGYAINLCKVCELAKGKFILLLSDEDLLNLDMLDKVLERLNEHKNVLSVMRTSGTFQAEAPSTTLTRPGLDSLLRYAFSSNYMSGIIYNNELLKNSKGIEFVKNNLKNEVCFYYPHSYWEILLFQYGCVKGTKIALINEGEAQTTEVAKIEVGTKNKNIINYYASFEGRLAQHKDYVELIRNLEICKKDFNVFRKLYINLTCKTFVSFYFAIKFLYKDEDCDAYARLEEAYKFCSKFLDDEYNAKNMINKKAYKEDKEKIKVVYDAYKKKLESEI
ncbi:glycosyltransferase [Clostridium sp. YIM B02551]|uniref:glycosyltransferase n=1 Tax=Clostridium sp. YIM B02551 TaxID=2910679 RepID=UPI001EEC87FE|nr:glycosyltransferase [Clostridium sp. YIM B02551]